MQFSSSKLIIALSCMLLSLLSIGQEIETPAYIIQLNGDTLKGFIDYRDWEKNPSAVEFKMNQADSYTRYTPSDIAGYGVGNEVYKSATVETEVSSDDEILMSHDPKIITDTVTVFLQELIMSEKGLYYYVNHVSKNQFYIYDNGTFELLVSKRYYKGTKDTRTGWQYEILTNKRYVGQLMNYFQDCPSMSTSIPLAKYNSTDLKNLFKKYYSCKGIKVKPKKRGKKLKIELGVLSGLSMTSLDFEETGVQADPSSGINNYYFYADLNPKNYIGFTPGIIVNIVWPYRGQKWSIYNEATYNTYKSSLIFENKGYGNYYDINADHNSIRLNNLLRYTHPFKNFNIFLNVGMANTLEAYYKGKSYVRDINTDEIIGHAGGFGYVTSEFAWLYGAGVTFNRVSLEYRLETFNGRTYYSYLSKSLYRNHLLLSYKFRLGKSK